VIGRVLGKYRILEQIGEGGMGVVYRGEHVMLGSPAAIKILLPQLTRDPVVVDRFFNEAKTTSAIRHPGIVQVFDYGQIDDETFIVMELLRGEDLTGFLLRRRSLDGPLAAQITLQLLSALEAAHVHGVIHRDIKPDNLFLVRDSSAPGAIRVKVLDFGIAKLIGDRVDPQAWSRGDHLSGSKTGGAILGTPLYMAPEQCRGGVEVDARADLYAAGCILFEMLVGRPPFDAETGGQIMAMHLHDPAPRLADFVPQLPPELDVLIAKMLAKHPDDRTPSAAWALAALERVPLVPLSGEVPLMGRAESQVVHAADVHDRPPRWLPIVVVAVALVVAGLLVVAIGFT